MRLRTLLFLVFLPISVRAAEVALVDDELGQALLVSNRGLCYAILPSHVSKDRDRIALAAPLPPTTGAGEIFWRDEANDLALAYVEGDLATRCSVDWQDLSRDLSARLQSDETGFIKSVHFGGEFFDRIGASIIDVDDTYVSVRLSDSGVSADVIQGLSGAMLSVGGEISGIAIDAVSVEEARFLRIDRIVELLGAKFATSVHPDAREIGASDTGLGFRVSSFEGGDRAGVVTLEPSGLPEPWVAEWPGEPVEFEITLSNDRLVAINRLAMRTQVSDEVSPPRRIQLQIDRGLPGSPYWSSLAAPDMSPTGVFDATTGGTVGRRIKITIMDVWFPDRPVRIDQLVLE